MIREVNNASPEALFRRKNLAITQVDHFLESRRAWRQFGRVEEVGVKGVASGRRAVNGGAAFVYTDSILRVVQTHKRSFVVKVVASPVLQVTQEIVSSPISPSVVHGRPTWPWE